MFMKIPEDKLLALMAAQIVPGLLSDADRVRINGERLVGVRKTEIAKDAIDIAKRIREQIRIQK